MRKNKLLFPTIEVLFSMAMILMFMFFAMSDLKQAAPTPDPSLFLSLGVGAVCLAISMWFFRKAKRLSSKFL